MGQHKSRSTWDVIQVVLALIGMPGLGLAVTGWVGGRLDEVLTFAEPWRTLTLLGAALIIVSALYWVILLATRWLRQIKRRPTTAMGPSAGGLSVTGLHTEGQIIGNIHNVQTSVGSFEPRVEPKPPPPPTPERLIRLADELGEMSRELYSFVDVRKASEPDTAVPSALIDFEESRRMYDAYRRETERQFQDKYEARLIYLYELADQWGYQDSRIRSSINWTPSSNQMKEIAQRLGVLSERIRAEADEGY